MASQDERYSADAYEAYEVYRGWRNVFFILMFVGLLVTGVSFWMVNGGLIDLVLERQAQNQEPVYVRGCQAGPSGGNLTSAAIMVQAPIEPEGGALGESDPAGDAESAEPEPLKPNEDDSYKTANFYYRCVGLMLPAWNYILPFSAVLYCLTLLIGMKLALVGRLGGLANSGRAFFLGLVVMVLVLPWQQMASPILWGALYTYQELAAKYVQLPQQGELVQRLGYYGRFVGLWTLTLLLLLIAQWRSKQATQIVQKQAGTADTGESSAEESPAD